MTNTLTRRGFVRTTAAAAASTALSRGSVLGAGERVRVGFIGVGNRGDQVLDAFLEQPDIEIAERFKNNAPANKKLRYEYRPPLRFPDAV